jgi:protein-tyrosine phosphatase
MDFSVAMAQRAVRAGIQIMVATPHVRRDYAVAPDDIYVGAAELNEALTAAQVQLEVVPGAEVAVHKAIELDDPVLRRLCLGSSNYILVESPYGKADVDLEEMLAGLQARGYRPVLAHPERSAEFHDNPALLTRLVRAGILCSVTAGALTGQWGKTPRRFGLELLSRALAHNVASDAHDHLHRPPDLLGAFQAAEAEMPGIARLSNWFTVRVPVAILAGRPVPERPPHPRLRSPAGLLGRLMRR